MTAFWHTLSSAFEAATFNWRWMLWNTWLALIPLALAYYLFRGQPRRTLLWWLGAIAFLAFLPNAPYVLTDIIHLVHDIRYGYSIWLITLVLVPQYGLFMLIGFESYVLSVLTLIRYLQRLGWPYLTAVELGIHGLCAIGVYLGRFRRFNSWDILTQPDALLQTTLNHLWSDRPLLIILITFVVISGLYAIGKHLTLALAWYWPRRHQLRSMSE
jgi:uncharacterized membrane protein